MEQVSETKLILECKSRLADAGTIHPEKLAVDLVALLNDSVACMKCDGHCCEKFNAVASHDRKPWSRQRAVQQVRAETHWQPCDEAWIDGDIVHVPCTCQHWDGQRCAVYDCRPMACRLFPLSHVLAHHKYLDCELWKTVAWWLEERSESQTHTSI